MPTNNPYQARRWVADSRSDSHMRWLRNAYTVTLNTPRPPSDSAIIRRALARLAEHMSDVIIAGRLDGLPGAHPKDSEAEGKLIDQYAAIATATEPPKAVIDNGGKFLTWQEAIAQSIHQQERRALSIPAPDANIQERA